MWISEICISVVSEFSCKQNFLIIWDLAIGDSAVLIIFCSDNACEVEFAAR